MNRAKPTLDRHHVTLRRGRRGFILGCGALASAALISPAQSSAHSGHPVGTSIEVERQGEAIVVQAQAEAGATLSQAFSTLADYDHLADFIPDLATSRTVARTGSSALVEQRGRASFGPFRQSFTLVLAVQEQPGVAIRAALAGGDFKRFDASYELVALDANNTRIEYRALLEPTAGVPPLVGVAIMRNLVRRQFEAMIGEIGRRSGAS